jgi:adenylosuccinate synthase
MFNFDPEHVEDVLFDAGWFNRGVHFTLGGQFGSEGKGALAAIIARAGRNYIDTFATNCGSNSGHTARLDHHRTIMTQQLPVAACVVKALDASKSPEVYFTGGAIIDRDKLHEESEKFGIVPTVHPCAAVILPRHREAEMHNGSSRIAGTAKGCGAALADKINREGNLWGSTNLASYAKPGVADLTAGVVLHEIAQGYSLGINQHRFAPATTSRNCSVQQACADADIPLSAVRKVAMACRSFAIRVGSTYKGYSGDCYPDQHETSWDELGVEPEKTTVTQRIRRVFTWSDMQFIDAVRCNGADLLFLSFLDYLPPDGVEPFVRHVRDLYHDVLPNKPRNPVIIGAFGPFIGDAGVWHE